MANFNVTVSVSSINANDLARMTLPALKSVAAENGIVPAGDKRLKEVWLNAILTWMETHCEQDDVMPEITLTTASAPKFEMPELIEVAQAVESVDVAVVESARDQAFAPEIIAALRAPLTGVGYESNGYTNKVNPLGLRIKDYVLNNGILRAYALLRSNTPIQLPAGFTVGQKLILPEFIEHYINGVGILAGLAHTGRKSTANSISKSQFKKIKSVVRELLNREQSAMKNLAHNTLTNKYDPRNPEAKPRSCAMDLVLSVLRNLGENAPVLVTPEIADVVKEVIRTLKLNLTVNVLEIDPLWMAPITGTSYEQMLNVFRVLEQTIITRGFSELVDERPLSLIEGDGEFSVHFGSHFKVHVRQDGEVALHELDYLRCYGLKPVMVCTPILSDRRYKPEEVRVLSALDQLGWALENYVLVDINRYYRTFQNANQANSVISEFEYTADRCRNSHLSVRKFMVKGLQVELQNSFHEDGLRRMLLKTECPAVVSVCPGLLRNALLHNINGNRSDEATFALPGKFTALLNDCAPKGDDIGRHLNLRVKLANLADAPKPDLVRVIQAASAHHLAQLPYGSMSHLQERMVALRVNELPAQFQRKYVLEQLRNHWELWGFTQPFSEANAAQALAGHPKFKSVLKGLIVNSEEFWQTVCDNYLVAFSSKEAKAMKRIASNYAQVCPVVGDEPMRLRYHGEAITPVAKPMKAALLLQHPVAPGMGFIRPGSFDSVYWTGGDRVKYDLPMPEALEDGSCFEFIEGVVEHAVPMVGTRGLVGYEFGGKATVSEDEVFGYYMDQNGIRYPLTSTVNGELVSLKFGVATEHTLQFFWVAANFCCHTGTEVKLRFGLKLNASEAVMEDLFQFDSSVGEDIDLACPQDTQKWMDSAEWPYPIIAETFCRSERLQQYILRANRLLKPDTEISDTLLFSKVLATRGDYRFLLDIFEAEFGRRIWFYEHAAAPEYAMLMTNLYVSKVEAGEWRYMAHDELPENQDRIPETAFLVTNAKDEVGATDCIIAYWEADGEHHVVIGGWGYTHSANGDFLYYPTKSEYVTIAQSVSTSSMIPFVITDLANRGYDAFAGEMLKAADKRYEEHIALVRMMKGLEFSVNGQALEVVAAADLFSEDEVEMLKEFPGTNVDWLKELARLKQDVLVSIPNRAGSTWELHLHLPTIARLGGTRINNADATIASRVHLYFWMLVHGMDPNHNLLKEIAGDIATMVTNYVEGSGHNKSLLRGPDVVTAKAAALSCIPTDEAWILRGGKLHRQLTRLFGNRISHVGYYRPPMTRMATVKLRVVSNDEMQGMAHQLSGCRFYMSALGMYFTWGDLDGDGVSIYDCSAAVRKGMVETDNLATLLELIDTTLGYTDANGQALSMLDPGFYASGLPAQYYAEHFEIASYKKLQSKMGVNFKKSIMTVNDFVAFQEAASTVQTVGVSGTYRICTLHNMFAEVLPVLSNVAPELGFGGAFDYLKDLESRNNLNYRVQSNYEVTLGGYSGATADANLGCLVRAVFGFNRDNQPSWRNMPGHVYNISPKSNGLGLDDIVSFDSLSTDKVLDGLVEMGYSKQDYTRFLNTAILAGVAGYGRSEEKFEVLAPELQVVLLGCQAVFDLSAARASAKQVIGQMMSVVDEGGVQEFYEHLCANSSTFAQLNRWMEAKEACFSIGCVDLSLKA